MNDRWRPNVTPLKQCVPYFGWGNILGTKCLSWGQMLALKKSDLNMFVGIIKALGITGLRSKSPLAENELSRK